MSPASEEPAALIADQRVSLAQALEDGPWRSRISEPHRDAFSRWHGDDEDRRAVYNNQTRLRSGLERQAFKFMPNGWNAASRWSLIAAVCAGVRLRGRTNIQKRYLIHVARYNLGLIKRLFTGAGTPLEFRARVFVRLVTILEPDAGLIFVILVATGDQSAAFAISVKPEPCGWKRNFSTAAGRPVKRSKGTRRAASALSRR
jgi:transposase